MKILIVLISLLVALVSCSKTPVKSEHSLHSVKPEAVETALLLIEKGLGVKVEGQTASFAYVTTNNPVHVRLAGNFNGWHTVMDQMKKDSAGVWRIQKTLKPGRYEYKYVEYGEKFDESLMVWFQDPANTNARDSGHGGDNSAFIVE